MIPFGEVDFNNPEHVKYAKERLKPLQALLNGRATYMTPIDCLPTEHTRIWKAEWYETICEISVIKSGFVAIPKLAVNGSNMYHDQTFEDCLEWYMHNGLPAERLRELFNRRQWFTVSMGRSLGWCEAGIMNWARANLAPMYVDLKAVPIYVLWATVNKIQAPSSYESTLQSMLRDHPLKDVENYHSLELDVASATAETAAASNE